MFKQLDIVYEINDGDLFLRKVKKDDSVFLYDSLESPNVNTYLSLGPLMSMEHSKRLIKSYLKYWDKYTQFTFIIELRDKNSIQQVGCVNIWNINWQHKRAEIGIWLIPEFFKQGIGKRVIALIKVISFTHLNLHRLEAHTAVENEPSIKLFRSSGFKEEGTLKHYINIQCMYHDAIIFAILKDD